MGEFRMPSLGADMDVGTIVEWLVKPGDAVHRGQIVAVVDTAKAAIEIEAFEEGVLEEILIGVGVQVPVGTPLAVIGTSDLAGAEPPARAGGGAGKGAARVAARARARARGVWPPAQKRGARRPRATARVRRGWVRVWARVRRSRASVSFRRIHEPRRRSATWPTNWESTSTRSPDPAQTAESPTTTSSTPPPLPTCGRIEDTSTPETWINHRIRSRNLPQVPEGRGGCVSRRGHVGSLLSGGSMWASSPVRGLRV